MKGGSSKKSWGGVWLIFLYDRGGSFLKYQMTSVKAKIGGQTTNNKNEHEVLISAKQKQHKRNISLSLSKTEVG